MTNGPKGATLYVGISADLRRRVWQHKSKLVPSFTSRYNLTQLVHYERFYYPDAAIARENEIKGWRCSKKIALIDSMNPRWEDLARDWQNIYKPRARVAGRSLAPLVKARVFGMTPPLRSQKINPLRSQPPQPNSARGRHPDRSRSSGGERDLPCPPPASFLRANRLQYGFTMRAILPSTCSILRSWTVLPSGL